MNLLSEREIVVALGEIDEMDNRWRVFMSILQQIKDYETEQACLPGLANEQRQYTSGRLAGVHDVIVQCYALLNKSKEINEQPTPSPS